ncbi:HAMP domain-containing sensor histidine kinase [Dokdonella soli]|uniref:histidine kinase n=1 Tax=Dokdonella soli TaxID=529810 RepID=A0ABN1J0H3_9GAMM
MSTLRAGVARRVALSVGASAALVLLLLYLLLRQQLIMQFDDELRADLRMIANITNVYRNGDLYVNLDADVQVDYGEHGDKLYEVLDSDSTEVVDSSPLLEEKGWRVTFPHPRDQVAILEHTLTDGRVFRLAGRRMEAQWGGDENTSPPKDLKEVEVIVIAGRDRAPLDTALWRLASTFIAAELVFALAAGFGAFHAASKGLTPLSTLTAELDKSPIEVRARPFAEAGPAEIGSVARALNRLLGRINMTMARERRFLADAAHELNTPLAELRTVNDVALLRSDSIERLHHAATVSRDVAAKLGETLKTLFALSRGEAGIEPSRAIAIGNLLRELWANAQARLPQRRLVLEASASCDVEWYLPPTAMRGLIKNLIDNAVAHAPSGSTVRASALEKRDAKILILENAAPDLDAEDISRLFEPFWRKEAAHTDRGHAGLGLTLAQDYAEAMRASIVAVLTPEHILRFTLRWPLYVVD